MHYIYISECTFTFLQSQFSKFLPLALFGVVALIAGMLALLLPETKGLSLPTTIKEAEAQSRRRKNIGNGSSEGDALDNEAAVMNEINST
jgi:hypothetical protein